ncbi:thiamine ABC transporter substrate-binding protein [Cellulosimicrobium arenosum]|uniref:Thiamine ABC transporter substrate-binding protein n=1 Tax=Cellulosimicrobium arenosum TaxID=2708133 RepID=A0A927G882_9MICO|nr:thiamine ABC transporter substrate-binding protein [Cellulosimicrobium arenosum]MBD8078719.1 thiamine ABC transporter substrate-binding protein [Cellulosimicrobium arenosum]
MTRTIARTRTSRTPRALVAAVGATAVLALAACSDDAGSGGDAASSGSGGAGGGTVTLVTHDSFAVSDDVLAAFEDESGLTVEQVAPGDGGALVNQLVLTRDAPLGDAVFGVDNTFASRAIDEGVLEPYTPAGLAESAVRYAVGDGGELTPVDVGDVCINVDHAWFDDAGIPEPVTLEDLTQPEYADLLVVTNPATSSPGLAFLLATVDAFGEDGYEAYWAELRDNGLKVADGWSDAYYVDFSGSEGAGPRPLVLSYSTSPAFTPTEDGTASTTGALLDTCFRQVEYAGVLAGAENPAGARQLVDFLVSEAFQADVPEQMYVYPADDSVELPAGWAELAPLADDPWDLAPEDISAHRDEWIQAWTATVVD